MGILTDLEKLQLQWDWRYKGISVLNLLTEKDCDRYCNELERIRQIRQLRNPNEWAEYDPFMYPHKESNILNELFVHPKIIAATEFLLEDSVYGLQTWAYFKPPGQLGRDMHQNIFYTECNMNEVLNVSIALENHTPVNGSVWYYEGSHRLARLEIEVDNERTKTNPKNWRNERGKPCIMPNHHFPKIEGYLRKGQAVFLHSNVVHGSETNHSDTMRRAFLCGYLKQNANFASGGHMKRELIDVGSARIK